MVSTPWRSGTPPFERCDSTLKLAEEAGLGTPRPQAHRVIGTPVAQAIFDFAGIRQKRRGARGHHSKSAANLLCRRAAIKRLASGLKLPAPIRRYLGRLNRVNPAETQNICAAITRKLSRLPPFSPAALKLLGISLDDESVVKRFEKVFKSDPALTAELLALANSVAFGGRSRIQTIGRPFATWARAGPVDGGHFRASFPYTARPARPYLASVWAHSIAAPSRRKNWAMRAGDWACILSGLPTTWGASACSLPVGSHTP